MAPPMLHVFVAEVPESLICWHPVPKPEHEIEEIEMIMVAIEQVAPTVAVARTFPVAEADASQWLG